MSTLPPGRVLGTPGGTLDDDDTATWAASKKVAAIGRHGEQRTAHILDPLCTIPGGATVLHDLRTPIRRYITNMDHLVAWSSHEPGSSRPLHTWVWPIDSKAWTPGLYWTRDGITRRWFTSTEFVDDDGHHTGKDKASSRNAEAGHDILERFLQRRNAPNVTVLRPTVVVHPHPHGRVQVSQVDMGEVDVMNVNAFRRLARKRLRVHPGQPLTADPVVVDLLATLLN